MNKDSYKYSVQAWFIPILILAMALMMLRPLVMASMLDTTGFATYSAGLLVSTTFCMLGCLGLQPMLQRKMPMFLMKGKELASLVMLIQGCMVAFFCATLASGFAFSGLSVAGLSTESLVISLLHGLSQQLFVLITVESKSRGEALRFSWQNLVRASMVVSVATFVAWYTQSPNMVLLLESIISLFLVWRISMKLFSRSSIHLGSLLVLSILRIAKIRWKEAFALMAVMLMGFVLINVDRWLAVSWLAPQQFALYAFAWILITTSQSIQSIVNSSIYPSLARRYAANGRPSTFRLAAQSSLMSLIIGTILVWPGYYILEFLISNWLLEYSDSLKLIPVFIAIALVRLSDFWTSNLIIIGKERLLLFINLIVGSAVLLIWFHCIHSQFLKEEMLIQLSWLALLLTTINYIFVMLAAVIFRR